MQKLRRTEWRLWDNFIHFAHDDVVGCMFTIRFCMQLIKELSREAAAILRRL